MGDLSKNFSRKEFACKCCGEAEVSPFLVEQLQRLRDYTGEPVKITSGFRCAKHNAAVGGAINSQHLKGLAADIVVSWWPADDLLRLLRVLVRANALYVGYAYKISKDAVHFDVREPESLTVVSWRR